MANYTLKSLEESGLYSQELLSSCKKLLTKRMALADLVANSNKYYS